MSKSNNMVLEIFVIDIGVYSGDAFTTKKLNHTDNLYSNSIRVSVERVSPYTIYYLNLSISQTRSIF